MRVSSCLLTWFARDRMYAIYDEFRKTGEPI